MSTLGAHYVCMNLGGFWSINQSGGIVDIRAGLSIGSILRLSGWGSKAFYTDTLTSVFDRRWFSLAEFELLLPLFLLALLDIDLESLTELDEFRTDCWFWLSTHIETITFCSWAI